MDIMVENHGSLVFIVAASERGLAWLDHSIMQTNEDYQPYWERSHIIVAEPRYVESIIEGARSDGLVVGG